jgi:hypothetical protein
VFAPTLALFGIAEEARRNGHGTSLVSLDDIDAVSIRRAHDALVEDGVDGIVVLAPMTAAVEVSTHNAYNLALDLKCFRLSILEACPST